MYDSIDQIEILVKRLYPEIETAQFYKGHRKMLNVYRNGQNVGVVDGEMFGVYSGPESFTGLYLVTYDFDEATNGVLELLSDHFSSTNSPLR